MVLLDIGLGTPLLAVPSGSVLTTFSDILLYLGHENGWLGSLSLSGQVMLLHAHFIWLNHLHVFEHISSLFHTLEALHTLTNLGSLHGL